jgi:hypothetical protein
VAIVSLAAILAWSFFSLFYARSGKVDTVGPKAVAISEKNTSRAPNRTLKTPETSSSAISDSPAEMQGKADGKASCGAQQLDEKKLLECLKELASLKAKYIGSG